MGVQMMSNSMASTNGVHHFIRQAGMWVSRAGVSSACVRRFENFISRRRSLVSRCCPRARWCSCAHRRRGSWWLLCSGFTASHRSSLSRGNGSAQLVNSALVSSECACWFLVSQFCSVECDRRGRWVSPSGPTCQRLCRSAQSCSGSGTRP